MMRKDSATSKEEFERLDCAKVVRALTVCKDTHSNDENGVRDRRVISVDLLQGLS